MELQHKPSPALAALLEQSAKLHEQADALIKQAAEIRQRAVLEHCTVKPGDVVKVTGYAHEGKDMRVAAISLMQEKTFGNRTEEYFRAIGPVLRKDGTDSAHKAMASWYVDMTPRKGGL